MSGKTRTRQPLGIYAKNWDAVRVMSAMARQWVVDGMAGQVLSLRLEALPAVLSCLGIEPSPTLLAHIQEMENVMIAEFNQRR